MGRRGGQSRADSVRGCVVLITFSICERAFSRQFMSILMLLTSTSDHTVLDTFKNLRDGVNDGRAAAFVRLPFPFDLS